MNHYQSSLGVSHIYRERKNGRPSLSMYKKSEIEKPMSNFQYYSKDEPEISQSYNNNESDNNKSHKNKK